MALDHANSVFNPKCFREPSCPKPNRAEILDQRLSKSLILKEERFPRTSPGKVHHFTFAPTGFFTR